MGLKSEDFYRRRQDLREFSISGDGSVLQKDFIKKVKAVVAQEYDQFCAKWRSQEEAMTPQGGTA